VSYRRYDPPQPLLFGYDPVRDLPPDHLARLVEAVVEETVQPTRRDRHCGQPPYDPRLCLKVLVYGYATGVRSSRQLERHCRESLPYLFLTRGDTPSYRTLCTARTQDGELLQAVWEGLFTVAAAVGLERLGKITVDSTKLRANASPEAVVKREEFLALHAELQRIVAEAAQVDAQEAAAQSVGQTELGKVVPHEQMRDILRRVRRERRAAARRPPGGEGAGSGADGGAVSSPSLPLADEAPTAPTAAEPAVAEPAVAEPAVAEPATITARMLAQLQAGLQALEAALADGRKHLCLTDPDARMMGGGRERQVREGHSFEVAVDAGLLVAAQTTQEPADNARLEPLVQQAQQQEPHGVRGVTADSGYYAGDAVARLEQQGIDTCVPDSNTAADLHRGQPIGTTRAAQRGTVPFTYDAGTDVYRCPEGNTLAPTQQRAHGGQQVTVYRAQEPCPACPQAPACLTQPHAQHRTLKVGRYAAELEAARQRFAAAEHQERYRHRGEEVETIFGFLRGTLGYGRWLLRGAAKVACEGQLFALAYQFRKVQRQWAG
jgi:transposase